MSLIGMRAGGSGSGGGISIDDIGMRYDKARDMIQIQDSLGTWHDWKSGGLAWNGVILNNLGTTQFNAITGGWSGTGQIDYDQDSCKTLYIKKTQYLINGLPINIGDRNIFEFTFTIKGNTPLAQKVIIFDENMNEIAAYDTTNDTLVIGTQYTRSVVIPSGYNKVFVKVIDTHGSSAQVSPNMYFYNMRFYSQA